MKKKKNRNELTFQALPLRGCCSQVAPVSVLCIYFKKVEMKFGDSVKYIYLTPFFMQSSCTTGAIQIPSTIHKWNHRQNTSNSPDRFMIQERCNAVPVDTE